AASCSIETAALGVCECSQDKTEGWFEVCATERIAGREDVIREAPANPQPKPLRLCSWYANGTIDLPTLSVITAWVPIGSRLCIGDEVPEATQQVVSIDDEVSDVFGATSRTPFAYWSPGSEVEVGLTASFFVELAAGEFAGNLLGRSATIRFEPVTARWKFSDGEAISGFGVDRIFQSPGSLSAVAKVRVRVSYLFDGGTWQQSDAEIWLSSNELAISVVEIPRRTLLVTR
ncbi:MAG: hypothetical protein ACO3S6_02875, partial [Aquiluna sp.]